MSPTTHATAEELHQRMVATIIGDRAACTEPVIAALRAVPRHRFLPHAPLEEAYDPYTAAITKRAEDGSSLSCASVPTLVADMLEHLHVRPGDRIFECGAGTGYNAALLAELTGILQSPKHSAWSAVRIGPQDPLDGIWLRASATDPTVCRIEATRDAVTAQLCAPVIPMRSPALVTADSLAYLAHRPIAPDTAERTYELGAVGHGPHGPALAERLCSHIQTWNTDPAIKPAITAFPRPTHNPASLPGTAILKNECAITITY